MLNRLIIFGIVLFIFSACNTLQRRSRIDTASAGKRALSDRERIEITRTFFNANKEKLLGNNDRAAILFSDCIRKDPSNAASMYELAKIYGIQGKREKALFFAIKAAAIDPENVWYQLLLADAYMRSNLFNKAVTVYKQLVKDHPDRIDYYNEWANTLLYMGKNTEAIDVYNKIEDRVGVMEEISFQKERIYIKLNKIEKAVEELEKLIKTYPNEPKYYGMLAELYQANGLNEKALETYQLLLEMDPDDPLTHLSLADYYHSLGERETSFNELKIAFSAPNLDIDTKVNILLAYYAITANHQELKEQALALCKILVEIHPDAAKSHSIYGDFLYRDEQFEDARDQYRLAVNLVKDRYVIWRQLLAIESELKDFDAMLRESNEAIELFPNQAILYLFNGIANVQLKKHQEAIEILNKGVDLARDNEGLLADFYSNLGDTYHTEKNMEASDSSYDKALEINPNNHFVLNNYSYYLSLRGEYLEKAKEMSKKSNDIDPGNTSFQDTYGWILYRLGHYSEAKIWLEKAIESGGNTRGVVLEHYGDILFKLGEREKAIEYWNKAKNKGGGSDLLDKKIADKNLHE